MNGIASAQSSPGLVLLGIAALVAVRFFYFDRSDEPEDFLHLAMSVVGRTMIAIGLMEGCLLLLSWFTLILLAAGVCVAIVADWRYQASRRAALLVAMSSAAQKFMPLAPAVEAFADEWRGGFRRRARRLANSLAAGTPLSQALRQTRGLISPKALSVIEAGEEAGVLSAAIGEAARLSLPRESLSKAALPLWYLIDMLLVAGAVIMFLLVKIIPAFIKIFSDFDAELPAATIVLVQFFDFFANYFYVAFPMLLPFLLAAAHFALRYFGLSTWDPPLVAAVTRRLDIVSVLRLLAVTAEAGRPLEPALAVFARNFPNPSLRRRLRRVKADVDQGADCWESFRDHGLLRPQETAMLKSAARVGNLPWLLGLSAAGIERKFAYRLQVLSQFLLPAAVLAIGALVFCIVVGLFMPLISLIERLT
ncbi:MAG TPA: type II secretion system F family protein [Pirellulales bacterium]|nr:type II secretion system F family protein [Pirellulales bacterium]